MEVDLIDIGAAIAIAVAFIIGLMLILSIKLPETTEQTKDYEDSLLYPFAGTGDPDVDDAANEGTNEDSDSNSDD